MIFLIGTSDDSTTRYFAREAVGLGADIEWLDLAEAAEGHWHIEADGAAEFRCGSRRTVILPGASVYARLALPGDAEAEPEHAARCTHLVAALASWLELSGGRVVNRPGHCLDNGSKPLHEALLARAGFLVPPSLTSADPLRLGAFADAHSTVVKSISGVRADCRGLVASDLDDFHPEQGPIHLQRAIQGTDVRVHVIDDQVIAVAIRSACIDYRIAEDAKYSPCTVPANLATRMVAASREMGLAFSGWDFKLSDEDGQYYTLEANPMPGYHPYDRPVERSITRALVDYLEADR